MDTHFANFGASLFHEIVPLYGIAFVAFFTTMGLRPGWFAPQRILTIGVGRSIA